MYICSRAELLNLRKVRRGFLKPFLCSQYYRRYEEFVKISTILVLFNKIEI